MRDPDSDPSRSPVAECSRCGEVKEHDVTISIREAPTRDRVRGENEKFSRQPYVVYRCPDCGRSRKEKVA